MASVACLPRQHKSSLAVSGEAVNSRILGLGIQLRLAMFLCPGARGRARPQLPLPS